MCPRASRFFLLPLGEIRYAYSHVGITLVYASFKVYRAIQYFARFYDWLLLSSNNKADAAKWNALKSHLALGRKCALRLSPSASTNQLFIVLRLAKPVEHLQAALRATQTTGPLGEQLTTVARQLAYFFYLGYDAIVWANAIKFINLSPEKAQRANKIANRFWLSGITLSIINAAFKTQRISAEISRLQHAAVDEKVGSAVDREVKLRGLEAYAHPSPTLTFNAADHFIPVLKQRPNSNSSSMRLTSGSRPLRSDL